MATGEGLSSAADQKNDWSEFDLDVPLFHGSREAEGPITSFRPTSVSVNASTFGDIETERTGIFLTDRAEFAEQYGPYVHAYVVRAGQIADVTDDLRYEFLQTLDAFEERDLWIAAKYGVAQAWNLFEGSLGRRFVSWLQDEGYDAATFREDIQAGEEWLEATTTVVFSPENVRPLPTHEPKRQPRRVR